MSYEAFHRSSSPFHYSIPPFHSTECRHPFTFTELGGYPQQWKTSSVIPIPKSSTNTDDPHNYCHQQVTGETCIALHVSQHLAEEILSSDAQWGFTPGKSIITCTCTARLSNFHDILQFLEYIWHGCLPYFFRLVTEYPTSHFEKIVERHQTGAACPSMVKILSE